MPPSENHRRTPLLLRATTALLVVAVAAVYGSYALRGSPDAAASGEAEASAVPQPTTGIDPLEPETLAEGLPSSGHWRGKPALADLDGDGHLDLVTALRKWDDDDVTESGGLFLWRGDGAGNWEAFGEGIPAGMGYGGARVLDADADGDLDIAFSCHNRAPLLLLGDGAGNFEELSGGIEVDGPCSDVALGDLDGDGIAELAAMAFFPKGGGLSIFARDDGGWRRIERLLTERDFGAQLRLHDLDGDERPEIFATTETGPKVWRANADGFEDLSAGLDAIDIGGSDLAVVPGDPDGDGACDLLIAGMTYEGHAPLRLYRWTGEAWERYALDLPTEEAFFDADFGDLDGDGSTEIVAAGKYGVRVFRRNASGDFESAGRLPDSAGVLHLTTGDVDRNGVDEIVTVGFAGVRVLNVAKSLRGIE